MSEDLRISDWQRDKAARKAKYEKTVRGWKLIDCTACNGAGYYDNDGSPKCSGCDGTGKERVSPEEYAEYVKESRLRRRNRRIRRASREDDPGSYRPLGERNIVTNRHRSELPSSPKFILTA